MDRPTAELTLIEYAVAVYCEEEYKMLNSREKEIIRILYCKYNDKVYTLSGPDLISHNDYKEISEFLLELKGENN